jgi:hypothetical protein
MVEYFNEFLSLIKDLGLFKFNLDLIKFEGKVLNK